MSNELISVIIPVYNVEKYIEEALSSITSQTYNNLEIILVNDCSTDNSGSICNKWALKDSRIKVIHKSENEGVCSARNIGLRVISGNYVYFMDPDDILSHHIIEFLYTAIIDNNADIAICNEIAFDENRIPSFDDIRNDNVTLEDAKEYMNHFCDPFTGHIGWIWNKLYTRSAISNALFEEFRVGEDIVFNAQVSLNIKKAVWITNKLYGYRIHESSATAAGKKDFTLESARSWQRSYEILSVKSPSFSKKYIIYLLGKYANLRAQSRFLFGKDSEEKMKLFYNETYDKVKRDIVAISVKDKFKLFLARYAFEIYYMLSTK